MGKLIYTPRCKNAKVYFRLFPNPNMCWEHVKILEDMKTIYVRYLQDLSAAGGVKAPSYWKFKTDGIFYNNTQEEIYKQIIEGVLEKAIEGCNVVILAFGQIGSGKSLTTSGLQNSFKDRGIAPRLISDLFDKKDSMKHLFNMGIEMSYIETHKKDITDLLNPNCDKISSQGLRNITVKKAKNEHTALKILFKAEGKRRFSEDYSTSHDANGVLTLHVSLIPHSQMDPIKKLAKIHIVDLAGVDMYGNMTSIEKSVDQIGQANLVKSQLEQFILNLYENMPSHTLAKQRLNILIQYLGDALSTSAVLRFIGHLRIDRRNLLILLSMLRFGQLITGLKPEKLHFGGIENEKVKLKILKQELEEIKRMQDIDLMIRNGELSRNITQERITHMQNVAKDYLEEKTDEMFVANVTDVITVLKVFKALHNKIQIEKQECSKHAYEKAYEDALVSIRKITSKTDSLQSLKSGKKGSRKSLRSREGSIYEEKGIKSKQTLKRISPAHSEIKTSSTKVKPDDKLGILRVSKHSRNSSINISKKSPVTRYKSASSTATTPMTGINDSILELELPEYVPVDEEAWNMFINDTSYNYRDLMSSMEKNEKITKNIHKDYIREVNNLQKILDLLDGRKVEYEKAQMVGLFWKESLKDDESGISTDLENVCLESLNMSHTEVIKQQEKVLGLQTEFRIALQNCQNIRKTINEKYELFCRQKFQIAIPKLDATPQIAEDNIKVFSTDDEQRNIPCEEKNYDMVEYENLKQVMKNQIDKAILQRNKPKKWIRSCKI